MPIGNLPALESCGPSKLFARNSLGEGLVLEPGITTSASPLAPDAGRFRSRSFIPSSHQDFFSVRPSCAGIDDEAGDCLPNIHGAANFTVGDDVRKPPYNFGHLPEALTTWLHAAIAA